MTRHLSADIGAGRRRSTRRVAVLAVLLLLFVNTPPGDAQESPRAMSPKSVVMVHVVPAGITPTSDMAARATATVAAVQVFLSRDVGRTLRIDRGIAVAAVSANTSAWDMYDELVAGGLNDPDKIYLVFADGPGNNEGCGTTFSRGTGPTFSFLLMPACDIYPGTGPQVFPYGATYLVLHELLHALGAVPACAPNGDAGAHATDLNTDMLYAGPRDWDNLTVDAGRDDYYGHSNDGCLDIQDSPYWVAGCGGLQITIDMNTNGGNGNGTAGPDVIRGTQGDDVINGFGGDDIICAEGGRDFVRAGFGNDTIFGGSEIDRIWGDAGDDTIYGEGGSDRIRAGSGSDIVFAGSGADRVWGGPGDDILNGMGGQDSMWGDAGNDTMQGNWQSDSLYGGPGNDKVYGAGGKDKLFGEGGNDELFGGVNTDYLHGGTGVDVANGGKGKDNPLVTDVSGCVAETRITC